MCGIFGYIGELEQTPWAEAHQLVVALALASERRGTDACGYAALTSRGPLFGQRQPGPARGLFLGRRFAELRERPVRVLIGHTRQATTGAPACNANNHPHQAGAWRLVHNGYLPHHRARAAHLQLPLRTECDSEVLVQALHRYGAAAGPRVCLSLEGKQSVLALNGRTRRLLAWTNGQMPLVAFRVRGWPALWWASTAEIAREALEAVGRRASFGRVEVGVSYELEVADGRVVVHTLSALSRP